MPCYLPTCDLPIFSIPPALFHFDVSNLFIPYNSELEAMNGNDKKTNFRQIFLKAIE